MAEMGKLNVRQIETSKKRILIDGNGLRLISSNVGARSWVLRMVHNGREYNIGLGSYPEILLADARNKAIDLRRQILNGIDPIAEKRKDKRLPTFEEAARQCHKERERTYRNIKHANQWINTLRDYAFPHFGNKKIDQINHAMIFNAISQIWLTKNETARRVRQRIIAVIDWAVSKGYREQSIALATITNGLPKYTPKVQHHAALPYTEIKELMANLRNETTIARLALEMAILTGSRSGEIRLAEWSQFDLEKRFWVRPEEVMKNKMVHIVPLTDAMLEILTKAKELSLDVKSDIVFQGIAKLEKNDPQTGKRYTIRGILSENTMLDNAKAFAKDFKITTHGFRSTFRDWAREQTHFKDDVAEKCLSHTNKNQVEAAYLRTDLIKERSQLMNQWNDYCLGGNGKVIKWKD